MPPQVKRGAPTQELVSIGRRDVFSKSNPSRLHGKRDEHGQKPTTSKALILRNGKYGAQGTGELMLMGRMSGREKLDLLAENLVEESKKAILSPLRLEKCLKMAEAQCDVYIDDISDLRDPETFRFLIERELQARADPSRTEVRRNPSYVAKSVATRIHNSYMLASAWKLVSDKLNEFAVDGLTDRNAKLTLKNNPDMRQRYLVLCDMVDVLVKMNQDRFSVLATTAPHYAKYFKLKPTESSDPSEPEYIFDWKDLRGAADSFLDSIIIELCFPQGTYPKAILYHILHDAIDESPREAKRFPQALWDAVGDLSNSVELQELLASPLFGPEGDVWKKQPRQMPEEYENWIDAQLCSTKASDMFATFKDMIWPLEKARSKTVLDNMWKQIERNYIAVSGSNLNALWNLEDAFNIAPQWSAFSIPKLTEDLEDEKNGRRALVKKKDNKAKLLAITNGGEADSDDSMPGLQSVSNSDEEDESEDDTESDEYESDEDDYETDDDSGYNTEEEDEIRDFLREAMDAAHETNWLESEPDMPKEIDPLNAENIKGNPFLKLLGSLRGRMFNASPKLNTATRTEPRTTTARAAFRATPTGIPKAIPTKMPPKPTLATSVPTAPTKVNAAPPVSPVSHKATVEEVEDEDDMHPSSPKKKKKKPKKKKKKSDSFSDMPPLANVTSSQSLGSASSTGAVPSGPASKTPQASTTTPTTSSFMTSMTSLSLAETATAQSARSYLQEQQLNKTEKKVKSRPDHASLFSQSEVKKGGFFSRVSDVVKGKDKETEMQQAKQSFFSRLGKKTTGLMHQLLKPGEARTGMKWEHFLKVMREMGFDYDPSTAGSSVRFDPPDKNDPPITIHKPHPDPTLVPVMLHGIAKRLKERYGWNEEDLMRLDGYKS
ncbi:hypothetical protein BDN70DRAFT_879530 [Pholiota conissans]|uniref:Uncharacterized protein n=1 Tax=Pholiota conissans TaxID=109636 RepID=A0A9P5Z0D4_9AGAR|nr:hypothetical protein BDN70DRAFT_879530 [Pholiota conissans]